MSYLTLKDWLDLADMYAKKTSGCNKVAVGSVIVKPYQGLLKEEKVIAYGANKCLPGLCKSKGCLRKELYGEDSKSHRNPSDCRAIHSEIDAICSAARSGYSTEGATIFVTRYPCESCAKAIVQAGIKTVFYGGTADMSDQAKSILDNGYVDYVFVDGWKEDNSDR